jgi:hypothetical protein
MFLTGNYCFQAAFHSPNLPQDFIHGPKPSLESKDQCLNRGIAIQVVCMSKREVNALEPSEPVCQTKEF